MREAVEEFPEYEIIVTGHSLGGAVASLAAAQLRNDGYDIALVSTAQASPEFCFNYKQARELIRILFEFDSIPLAPLELVALPSATIFPSNQAVISASRI